MNNLTEKIEKIILQHGSRGMDHVRRHLEAGYCERAARLILANRGTVLIGTGFPVAGSFESDGPIGAIALYQVLTHLNYQPIFVCAPPLSKFLSKSFDTCEIPISSWDKSKKMARNTLNNLNPSLVVSVERPGITQDGHYYNMHGKDISAYTARYDLFFDYANCPTIAFGDGGNEIGMGNVHKILAGMNVIPSVTSCDELVISTVSNWGVYGVIALMSHQLKKDLLQLIQPEAIAGDLLANGSVDGVTTRRELSEDGFPIDVGVAIIHQLREYVIQKKEALMAEIKIERKPGEKRLKDLGIADWPIWTKEESEFPWSYDEPETCYFLKGDVVVTPEGGEPVTVGEGDLVTFPKGMSCTWKVRKDVKKHYKFG